MLEKDRKEFVEAVEKAFKNMKYPGDEHIVYHSGVRIDDCEVTLKSFKGKHWREVSLKTLILNRDHLPWFTPNAFRFYLPAYLIAVILHFEKVDVLSDNTLSSLTPVPQDDPWYNSFVRQVTGFDPAQKAVIRKFLNLYARLNPSALHFDPQQHLKNAIKFWDETEI